MATPNISNLFAIIYGLIDPRDQSLRYVGKTKHKLQARLNGHLNDVRRGRVYIPRHKWIAEILASGLTPIIVEIDRVPDSEWQESEQFWIGYLRFVGCRLLNATDGGDGIVSHRHSDETRRRMSETAKLRYQNPDERAKTGAAVKRGQDTEEYREAHRNRALNFSAEHMSKFRAGANQFARSEEGRAKTSKMARSRVLTEETRRKLSIAHLGTKWSAERCRAQSERLRGRRHSEETKAKMRASADPVAAAERSKKRWADPAYVAKQRQFDKSSMLKKMWSDPELRAKRLAQNQAARERKHGTK